MPLTINNSLNLEQVGIRAFTPSTLLIPKKLINYYDARATSFGSRKLYFQHLIITYGRHLIQFGLEPVSTKWKKEYQKEGLNLQPRHFKPAPEYWEEFRHIGLAYGLGMCKLFVILLKLEHDRWIEAGSPENFCENPLPQPYLRQSGMNSWSSKRKNQKSSLESLLNGQRCTILIRKIDFREMNLDRIAIIRQD